jgi:3-oxoacyl-(acyl-carrier-protein) synthase/3-hydroxymyristoyl/3-hydroxydecanoyl-(acyl carrier protein) dehydratase/1-acyl-sn-glycerol-3-phosphate acyltransferase
MPLAIAIVGRGCVLPGAASPDALWEAVAAGRDLTSEAPPGRWRVDASDVRQRPGGEAMDRTWGMRGGYAADVTPDPALAGLDPLFQLAGEAARQALVGVRHDGRADVVLGNLSFPTSAAARRAEGEWLGSLASKLGIGAVPPQDRFHSGLPARLVASSLGLSGAAFSLDAACASSLYAIRYACDRLTDGEADLVLAGAVNRADDLFIHVGFCALKALSTSGRSRPFHRDADGLLPAEGAAIVALKRLEDARRDGDPIFGIIRAVGLSNDGRVGSLLSPAVEGQERALRAAYAEAGWDPRTVGLVECHATGTTVGDAAEIESAGRVFQGCSDVPIGSLKGNLGHLVTAAGAAGLIKVLEGFRRDLRPPTRVPDAPNPALAGSPFRLVAALEPWSGPRRAAVSAFGFGGNNAHLLVESPEAADEAPLSTSDAVEIAVVALSARVGDGASTRDFAWDVLERRSRGPARTVSLALDGLRFPPKDLQDALPQQWWALDTAREAANGLALPRNTTAVWVGMGCDAEIARYGARWRAAGWGRALDADAAWVDGVKDGLAPGLTSAGVLGTMPNIPANRINTQLDVAGPSHTVAAEESSGLVALQLAIRGLRHHTIDAAVVGAVDLSHEPVHQQALAELVGPRPPGDAAVTLILKRKDDAARDGDRILAIVDDLPADTDADVVFDGSSPLTDRLGCAHAAVGLVQVAAAVVAAATQGVAQVVATTDLLRQTSVFGVRPAGDPVGVDTFPGAPTGNRLTRPAHAAPVRIEAPTPMTDPFAHLTPLSPDRADRMTPPPALAPVLDLPTPRATPRPAPTTRPPAAPPAPTPSVPAASVAPAVTRPTAGPGAVAPPAVTRAPSASVAASAGSSASFLASTSIAPGSTSNAVLAAMAALQQQAADAHDQFLDHQRRTHRAFLDSQARLLATLTGSAAPSAPAPTFAPTPAAPARPTVAAATPPTSTAATSPAPTSPAPTAAPTSPVPASPARPASAPALTTSALSTSPSPAVAPPAAPKAVVVAPKAPNAGPGAAPIVAGHTPSTTPYAPPGLPTFDKAALLVHAGGNISEIFGERFTPQDHRDVVVRMPLPPLLLADRVTGIQAEPASMGTGTLWTESDLQADAFYMVDGRVPPGIMIESGQADLMLISWLGVDLFIPNGRRYRLLGCELVWHGDLPKAGETLSYDIHIDSHAALGDVRLFFFHYDCTVNGETRLTVRQGQAGFFTEEELDDSKGVLWTPEEAAKDLVPLDRARLDPPRFTTGSSFDADDVAALCEGRVADCFGPAFARTRAHTASPHLPNGRMRFLDAVTDFDPKGGPWRRGYLRAVQNLTPETWFFDGHFKNDPCMPGTLMLEACLQTMAFYLIGMGFTVNRDGWRFQPVPEEPYLLRCRGQVRPHARELVYEVFVEEVMEGDRPRLYADLLCTVDGLKAFHCRRMGLELVPDWPLDRVGQALLAEPHPGPVAEWQGFRFDYDSLLACAWGRPSRAFGAMYERFDSHRTVARLPGPPYHFMHRVEQIDGPMGVFQKGTRVTAAYDVPDTAWYFDENGTPTMPLCVLMEAALQPCGWLASYIGSALLVDSDLMFRNLDGTGTQHNEVTPGCGTLRTTTTVTSVSRMGTMIILSFDVRSSIGDTPIFDMKTTFGFFPPEAFAAQAGLPRSDAHQALFDRPADCDERVAGGEIRVPAVADGRLMMLDRIDHLDLHGGRQGLGTIRSRKHIEASEWCFAAHFYQDPVQPGSLGIEAFCQILQVLLVHRGDANGIPNARFEPIAMGVPLTWKYRGQVVPENHEVTATLELLDVQRDGDVVTAIAEAWLWVDGKPIYRGTNLGMRIVPGTDGPTRRVPEEVVAPDGWVADHRPTWTVPALPALVMADRLTTASGGSALVDLQVKRWVVVNRPTRLFARKDGDDVVLWSDDRGADEVVATAKVASPGARPEPWPALTGPAEPDPYDAGVLFHGPAFQLLKRLIVTDQGSSAILDASRVMVPGRHHPALLDAATHGIPHDAMWRWSSEIGRDLVAYPARVARFEVFGPAPTSGDVRVEARFAGFDGAPRFPIVDVQIVASGAVWCAFRLVEATFPKGAIGTAAPADRRAFLRDRASGLHLSRFVGEETRLSPREVQGSDWLPGTVDQAFGVSGDLMAKTASIAAKEHVGRATGRHPTSVSLVTVDGAPAAVVDSEPITARPVSIATDGLDVVVKDHGAPRPWLGAVRAFWDDWFGLGRWPVEDVYYALIERFVGRVVLADPAGFEAIRGKSALYLANHQVGVESLLFSILAGGLSRVPTVTLAKAEHRGTWLGHLIRHCFAYPGVRDPKLITYFDRDDKASLPKIIGELAVEMQGPGRSVMVHVEGTRSLSCRTPVQKMSGAFLDMAIAGGVPVVPVRFVGGLPAEPLEARIEFPVGMGKQDIYIGSPIAASELAKIPYGPRKQRVIDAINALGPGNDVEAPFASDPDLERRAAAWQAARGVTHEHATILEVLRDRSDVTAPIRALLAAADGAPLAPPPGPEGAWLTELAGRLLGGAGGGSYTLSPG